MTILCVFKRPGLA